MRKFKFTLIGLYGCHDGTVIHGVFRDDPEPNPNPDRESMR